MSGWPMRCPREQGVGLMPSSHRDWATWRELVALTRAGSVSAWGQEPGGSEGGERWGHMDHVYTVTVKGAERLDGNV